MGTTSLEKVEAIHQQRRNFNDIVAVKITTTGIRMYETYFDDLRHVSGKMFCKTLPLNLDAQGYARMELHQVFHYFGQAMRSTHREDLLPVEMAFLFDNPKKETGNFHEIARVKLTDIGIEILENYYRFLGYEVIPPLVLDEEGYTSMPLHRIALIFGDCLEWFRPLPFEMEFFMENVVGVADSESSCPLEKGDSLVSVPKQWESMQDSCLFRRGRNMACPSKDFLDIARSLEEVVSVQQQIRVLIIGVARGEEPLSILAVLNAIAEKREATLDEVVDLHLVDIRPPISPVILNDIVFAWTMEHFFPDEDFVTHSLIIDERDSQKLRIKPSIRDYLVQVMANPSKCHLQTDIRDFLGSASSFDAIVYNNVHGHVPSSSGKTQIYSTLNTLLKVDGVLITDPEGNDELRKSVFMDNKQAPSDRYSGIYRKRVVLS